MASIFSEIRTLKEEGKLHEKLTRRVRILFLISFLLLLVVIWNIYADHITNYLLVLMAVFWSIGFFLGFYIFSQMNVINWSEEDEVVRVGNMDAIGFASIILYIIFEISFRTFLKAYFPGTAIPLLLAGICGTIMGRAIGTLIEIHRVYLKYHDEKNRLTLKK